MSQSVLVISTDYRATRDLGVRECGSVFFPTVRSRQWQQATASPPAGSQANNTSVTSQNCESVEPESEATHITADGRITSARFALREQLEMRTYTCAREEDERRVAKASERWRRLKA